MFFECSVKYEKTMENGMVKKVCEPYIVDALSFTEAESRFIEEITPYMSGEYEVTAVKKASYKEVVGADDGDADYWFKAKLAFITVDEKTGVEKRSCTNMLIQATDLRDAVKRIDKHMEGTQADYSILSVSETPIYDYYEYKPNDNDNNEEDGQDCD